MNKPPYVEPTLISMHDLRQRLEDILDQSVKLRTRFVISRAGHPMAILLSLADYHALEELVDTWVEEHDAAFQQSLLQARQEIAMGPRGDPR